MASLLGGVALTVLVTWILSLWQGPSAALPAGLFGGVAVLIQLLAERSLRRGLARGDTTGAFRGFGVGLGLRVLGVLLVLLAVLLDRGHFPPIPTAFGYLGVVIPLLFSEVRFVR